MPKATIKSKTGATIIIEGTKEELSQILNNFERATLIGGIKEQVSKGKIKKKEEKKRMAASDLIIGLREEGFFNKPKTLAEIVHALEELGRITPTTSLSGVMINLVQQRLVGRKKVDGKWVYGK